MNLLDALLPRACLACDAPADATFCAVCADTLVDADGPTRAAYAYGGALAVVVRRAKLASDVAAVQALVALFAVSPGVRAAAADTDGFAWVPAHPLRRALRGFDLPALLAKGLAAAMDKPLLDALRARRFDRRHARGADRATRAAKVRGRYVVAEDVRGRALLLVDDVVTSGATLGEAARVLTDAGARVVTVALAATPDGTSGGAISAPAPGAASTASP